MANSQIEISNKKGIFTLVSACHHFGVQDVIISPGSRNAPLTISFGRCGLFKCHSIPDERSAAFYAMGISIATNRPVAVICTSGSAAANLSPALAEAFYQKIPLVAITADRPMAWIDQGNGQTIRQEKLFQNFTVNGFSMHSEPGSKDEMWYNRRKLSEVFADALSRKKGPVHINVPLSEPLYGMKTYDFENDKPQFYAIQKINSSPEIEAIKTFAKQLSESKKVMILAGQMPSNETLHHVLEKYSHRDNVVILTETTSNINLKKAIDTIDRLIMPMANTDAIKDFMPDLLITIGGNIVSKKIKALLRDFQPKSHWHISEFDSGLDTFQSLTDEVVCNPEVFLSDLMAINAPIKKSDYNANWQSLKNASQAAHDEYISKLEYADFYAFREILSRIKAPASIHMANSSPVRYIQLFGHRKDLKYFGNRGTSGIDGCTSTAAGIAKASPDENHFLITGDTAFQYDINGLWNRDFPQNLKIILINNGGGGIFRIIEGPDRVEELVDFFEAYHPVDFEMTAKAHSLEYYKASDKKSLSTALPDFFNHKGAALIEIKTIADQNAKWLKNYFKEIEKGLKISEL
ncbi:2-succinyl-5-enolpyruvyl-6-hydroxy-3-cyclohexene-1-carboxylic-acid synthase [Cryomorpha ignava]|uniref:2-succinyl-5-enolpyruvyl-6-hydroxy-3-cyclohexene-1-carboxylate synthase n=1 Tax=Cryomorpha ignava TaxID=101383 RepID=A0A7K3WN12_9FLAO|nr:2-succinyl-5-enolpyruvyl-6-hydroxy-3-cyclohexene-1-carboxylic-acid synthase [Cryomorpha ignava]NEN22928.1 2-succinyl-5-enolpyruvyl-6-hydroxy-3-cyclohexene-1-carboxylic-acid synthase [Cryomorpha ignava]